MIDINKPVTNPRLIEAINKMREMNTNESQDEVINEVMHANFIAPVDISPIPNSAGDSNTTVLEQDTTIGFQMIENIENQKFFLVFTDWEELGKWRKVEGQQTLILRFEDLASMVLDENGSADGFVINPYSHNVPFSQAMVLALKNEVERRKNGGVVEQVVKKDATVQLGQPRVYPTELTQAISTYLKKQANVKAAYLQLMVKDEEQSFLVVVDLDGDEQKIFDGIGQVAMNHLNGMFIDLIPFDSDFGRKATHDIEPFYRKKKGWIFGR